MISSSNNVKSAKYSRFLKLGLNLFLLTTFFMTGNLFAQSTDQNSPTPLVTNELKGQIKARDIGDSRLTTYYFIFNGKRGDVFLNVVTSNLNGDIDVFTADTLKPRTKVTVYADSSSNETGRIIYMRKAEKLIMRIQGKTPNDDPATFQIKFAGSFDPISIDDIANNVEAPKVETENVGSVKVNSVGTIIEQPKEDVLDDVDKDKSKTSSDEDDILADATSKNTDIPEKFDPTKKQKTVLSEDNSILRPRLIKDKDKREEKTSDNEKADLTVNLDKKRNNTSARVTISRVEDDEVDNAAAEAKRLAKISLKVKLKGGETFKRAMNEVTSVNVIKTVLTIVTTDGKIHEFSIFDVSKMTID